MNSNITLGNRQFHVQSEDAEAQAELVTQVFVGGRVVHTYRLSYADWKRGSGWEKRRADRLHRQHLVMLEAIKRGRLASQNR